jgi:pseudouridine synthase
MRLNQYIARCGVTSRRGADELIRKGRISINGQIIKELGRKVNIVADKVFLDAQLLKQIDENQYVLLNKPAGVLTTVKDPSVKPTVMSLVPKIPGLVPVGRLDFDTEGVLLLTNDGELNYRLTHPRFKIDKIYLARVDRPLYPSVIKRLQQNIDIGEKKPVFADKVEWIDTCTIRLILHEGKKRQVRRMMQALGFTVQYLCREQFAFLRCDEIERSSWRLLNQQEIKNLKKLVEFNHGH